MRKTVIAAVAALVLSVAGLVVGTSASGSGGSDGSDGSGGKDVLEWDVMAGVDAPFTGPTNPIRGMGGGGVPWSVDVAKGELRTNGRLELEVEGLVLTSTGVNPSPTFEARVNCLTKDQPVNGVTRITAPVKTGPEGDAEFDTRVDLPDPCYAPIVFVTNEAGRWFAITGR
jgi:hypothetical protein